MNRSRTARLYAESSVYNTLEVGDSVQIKRLRKRQRGKEVRRQAGLFVEEGLEEQRQEYEELFAELESIRAEEQEEFDFLYAGWLEPLDYSFESYDPGYLDPEEAVDYGDSFEEDYMNPYKILEER